MELADLGMLLTDDEKYWLDVLEKSENTFARMENLVKKKKESKKDCSSDFRDLDVAAKYIKFLKMIIMNNNLKPLNTSDSEYTKRVIKIHRGIPTGIIEGLGFEYVIFNGLHIVLDVYALDKRFIERYMRSGIKNDRLLPDSLYNIPRLITDVDDHDKYIILKRNKLTEKFITVTKQWSYPSMER